MWACLQPDANDYFWAINHSDRMTLCNLIWDVEKTDRAQERKKQWGADDEMGELCDVLAEFADRPHCPALQNQQYPVSPADTFFLQAGR